MLDRVEKEVSLTNRHLGILRAVAVNQPIGIVNLSKVTDRANHEVRYSLRVLEEEAIIEPTHEGAVTTVGAQEFIETHQRKIDDLIERLRARQNEIEPPQT